MADLKSLIYAQNANIPNYAKSYQTAQNNVLARQLANAQLSGAKDDAKMKSALMKLIFPDGKIDGGGGIGLFPDGMSDQQKALVLSGDLAGAIDAGRAFGGTGATADSYNILLKGDPSSREYALAYAHANSPKTMMTPDGMVTMQPQIPVDAFPKPTYTGELTAPTPEPQQEQGGASHPSYLTPNQLKYNTAYAESVNLVDAFNDFAAYAQEIIPESRIGWKDVTGKELGQLQSKYGLLKMAMKGTALLELGVLAGADLTELEKIIADPTGLKANAYGRDYIMGTVQSVGENLGGRLGRVNEQFSGGNVQIKGIPQIAKVGGAKKAPPAAEQHLRDNPHLKFDFEKKYGYLPEWAK